MYSTSYWKRSVFGGALLLIGLSLALYWLGGSAAYLKGWLLPQDVELFVADQRVSGNFSRDLEHFYPSASQRSDGLHVAIRRVEKAQVAGSAEQLLNRFAETQNADEGSKLFIELPAPYSCSKKELRRAIDEQTRFTGEVRVTLLRRVVAIVGARPGSTRDTCNGVADASSVVQDACKRLDDDWAYMRWNYGGLGLAVDDRTMDLVGRCLPSLIANGKHG